MELIGNKTDIEFDNIFDKYASKFELQKEYINKKDNKSFIRIRNTTDLIDKLNYCKNINFYIELQVIFQYILQDIKNGENKPVKKIYKKRGIPSTMKRLVWNTNIGEEIGKAKCMCCNTTDITQMSFHCGHIIAEAKGGETIVSNLRPICQNCNSSMGCKNMEDFIKTLK